MTASRRGRGNARRRPPARTGRLRRAARGDRPFVALLLAVVLLIGAMAVGPLQGFTAAVERADSLEATRDQLRAEVDVLEERRAWLEDPEELELLARSELGMVRPGEIPFVVIGPRGDEDQVRPEPVETPDSATGPWHVRLWHALRGLFSDPDSEPGADAGSGSGDRSAGSSATP